MIVLGVSGLPNAQPYLRARNPALSQLDERICQGLDSAASLVVDGEIVAAAAEERFSGKKGTGQLPLAAINYCLEHAGICEQDIDLIAHNFAYDQFRRLFAGERPYFDQVLSGQTVVNALTDIGWRGVARRFRGVRHHVAHAMSAYGPSGFGSALCIVSDGMGEVEALTVHLANGRELRTVHAQPIAASLGLLYSICTRFLGFVFNSDEYKVMGLAAYGDPSRYRAVFESLAQFDLQRGSVAICWPRGALARHEGYPLAMAHLSDGAFPPRSPGEPLDQEHADFAAALQAKLSALLVALAGFWLDQSGERSLCLAGGTFLNCCANEVICNLRSADRVFIQPAAGDDGSSLGAALHASAELGFAPVRATDEFDPYIGPGFTAAQVHHELVHAASGDVQYRYVGLTDEYFDAAAQDIAADRIIAWFHARMEFGPRALGNRSILASPCGHDVKGRLNRLVKLREPFRPFAPSVLSDDCDTLFDTRGLSPTAYMLCTAQAKAAAFHAVPAAVHADGSARIHVVRRERNEVFWKLLIAVKRLTGVGCVVNTSFNVAGQPLIMSPATALETFERTQLKRLYIEGWIVRKTSE